MSQIVFEVSDEVIVKSLKKKLRYHEDESEKIKIALRAYGEDTPKNKPSQLAFSDDFTPKPAKASNKRISVKARVRGLLSDLEMPLTSREIMDKMNALYNKDYTFNNFSGNFSQMYRKKSSGIKKYELSSVPLEYRTVYGLEEWFNGEELKDEYVQKVIESHK